MINSGHLYLPFSQLDVYMLSDGYFGTGNPQPVLAPGIAPEIVQNELKRLCLQETYEAPIITMLVKSNDATILIDTGEGSHNPANAGWLLNSLTEIGVTPEAITDILITHAHQDHIGGILSEQGQYIFPNARYFISRNEWAFWTNNTPDFSNSRMPSWMYPSGALQHLVLNAIKDRIEIFTPGETVCSCIKTAPAPGHTPGHIIFSIFSEALALTNLVDLVHSPLLIAHPEWGTQWDIDFNEGVRTRKRILETCCKNRTLVATAHLPWPGIGYIGKTGDLLSWAARALHHPYELALS
ncbi:MBL fold metallo-hydrolase [Niabella beijingensis]|uniref:MBL fold metallo-hydrolase n=1 Tax=Niabella beijingensis TaxID=2872700 RepID=UPI001CC124D1|nr:MBL fold metallo-hydrolase [Niabella beijingensis]MBZ4191909.1 MBL fold metallo-hydrolase [Niabella beijingensis]